MLAADYIDYFKGALQIPNIEKDQTAFETNYIDPNQNVILTRALGQDLYNELLTNYDTEVDDKWKHLVEGADFTVTIDEIDYTIHWNGLVNDEQLSLVTYYTYYNYVQQNYQQVTGLGVGAQNMENATVIDPNSKLVWANNECVKLYGTYPYITTGENLECETLEPSLFNFILNNLDDYTNWVYTPLETMNVLGI